MTMTIQSIIAGLAEKYGNGWSERAVTRYAHLEVGPRNEKETQEYWLLRNWLLGIVELGIAFRQGNLVEH